MPREHGPSQVSETQPSTARVCPECRREWDALTSGLGLAGRLPRCPEHGLAYISESDLPKAGKDALLGKTLVDRFVILSRLGAGSMGAVYRARQEAVGRDVALKIVRRDRAYDPETKARFEREARAMSSLMSPHTVTVFDFGEADDGSWFLAMEMLRGETLGQRLRERGSLPWRSAVRIGMEALASLSEAHGKGIIHRDLKPDNLFLMQRPAPAEGDLQEMCKVLDFGIAKLEHEDQKLDQLETQAGTVFGTPRYMSPEQAQGTELDARSDIYSLGVILFQMLCGKAPFLDDDAVVVMAKHIKDPPPSLRSVAPQLDVPVELENVVLRALEKDPNQRFANADHLIAELQRVLDEVPAVSSDRAGAISTQALKPVARPSPPERVERQTLALVLGLGLFALGAVAGVVFWWSGKAVPPPAGVEQNLTLGAPAALPHSMLDPSPKPELPAADSSAGIGPGAVASAPSVAVDVPPPGPPTQVKPRVRAGKPLSSAPAGADEIMEPKRPDERYGRFR